MQETFLTLRGIHRLAIAGCITVLLLAITPTLAHRYQLALDELKQANADFEEFKETQFDIFGPQQEDREIADVINEVIVKDLKRENGLETAWAFRDESDSRILPRLDSSRELMKQLNQPLNEMSLAAIHDFSMNPGWHKPVDIVIPDATELRQKLLALLVKTIPKRFKELSTDSNPREVNLRVRFAQLERGKDFDGKVGFCIECRLDEQESWLLGFDVVAATRRNAEEPPAAYSVRNDFPHCHRVWSEVHGLNVSDAMALLKTRKADTTADVTVMGFSIPKHVALLLGPLATALLFLYLQLHVKHAIPRIQRHGWQVQDFPWIAFYSDSTSKRITMCTFVLLPLASCGLLTYSEWTLTGQFPWMVAGCTLFCTVSGIVTLERIRSIPTDHQVSIQVLDHQTRSLAA